MGAAIEYCNFHAIANMGAYLPSGSLLKTCHMILRYLADFHLYFKISPLVQVWAKR